MDNEHMERHTSLAIEEHKSQTMRYHKDDQNWKDNTKFDDMQKPSPEYITNSTVKYCSNFGTQSSDSLKGLTVTGFFTISILREVKH